MSDIETNWFACNLLITFFFFQQFNCWLNIENTCISNYLRFMEGLRLYTLCLIRNGMFICKGCDVQQIALTAFTSITLIELLSRIIIEHTKKNKNINEMEKISVKVWLVGKLRIERHWLTANAVCLKIKSMHTIVAKWYTLPDWCLHLVHSSSCEERKMNERISLRCRPPQSHIE